MGPQSNYLIGMNVSHLEGFQGIHELIGDKKAHYLQGSSTPEPCWTLLGTALSMAISFGFHQGVKSQNYSVIEREEGTRAWWLCYIMEK